MKSDIVSPGFCRNIGHYYCYWMTYISLGMLAASSSLWAIYMQDNAIVLVGLLLGRRSPPGRFIITRRRFQSPLMPLR